MTYEEYKTYIDNLILSIKKLNKSKDLDYDIRLIENDLNKLFKVKPVRLGWYCAKAMLNQIKGEENALDILNGKYTLESGDYEWLDLCKELLKIEDESQDIFFNIENNANYALFKEQLDAKSFFVIIEHNNYELCYKAAQRLLLKNCKVIIVRAAVEVENADLSKEDILNISIDNVENVDNILMYYPIQMNFSDGRTFDSTYMLLNYFIDNILDGENVSIITSGNYFSELSLVDPFRKKLQRVTPWISKRHEEKLSYGVYGDYLKYISKIYMTNCEKLLRQNTSKKFSIVIPARNSADTLRYTIMTCLNQTYRGDYEILISDNSTGGRNDVKALVDEFKDSKLVYLKTPRNLQLSRSFEYAFLNTRGEYVLSIGSDDGLLPWALESLNDVINEYPNEKIIEWERGFYAWPGFNGGQQNQLTIPRNYKKGNLCLVYNESKHYFKAIFEKPEYMYTLPLLYINSCFKREYMYDLLKKTGALWNGASQDIYMGIMNICINPKILCLIYPLSIAGMSAVSVGSNAMNGVKSEDEYIKEKKIQQSENEAGVFVRSFMEELFPSVGLDTSGVALAMLKAVNIGIMSKKFFDDNFDWKKFFGLAVMRLQNQDLLFEVKVNLASQHAHMLGEDFFKWFKKNVYDVMLTPVVYDEERLNQIYAARRYDIGKNSAGGLTVDASEYNVKNIYEAVNLFGKLSNLI